MPRVQITVVQAAQRVQAQQAAAGPGRHRGVVHVRCVVEGVHVREGSLRVGETGLVQQRDVLQAGFVRNVTGALGSA